VSNSRQGTTKAELKTPPGYRAGVAQNPRRMLNRGDVREEAFPSGVTGYGLADNRNAPSASGRESHTG
jgi:hypothetical protein